MELITSKEAAERLGISVKTLMGHVHDGSLPYINIGRSMKRPSYAFAVSDIEEFKEARRCRDTGPLLHATNRKTVNFTSAISNSVGIGFTALREQRAAAKRSG